MKIYTKTGDKGQTSLVSGRRMSKSDALIEAYGTVDELNSFVGLLDHHLKAISLDSDCTYIQHTLFNIGSILAKDGVDFPNYPELDTADITFLEKRMDQMDLTLMKMTAFILPAGSEAIAVTHICRTVCRRAERRVIILEPEFNFPLVVKFLNRLSDYFFVLARYIHQRSNIPEVKWDQKFRETD